MGKLRTEITAIFKALEKDHQQSCDAVKAKLHESCTYLNNSLTESKEDLNEKIRKVCDDLRRLHTGLGSEANVRMLDIENIFGRLQMVKEELQSCVESERRQRVLSEEKLASEVSGLKKFINLAGSKDLMAFGAPQNSSIKVVTSPRYQRGIHFNEE